VDDLGRLGNVLPAAGLVQVVGRRLAVVARMDCDWELGWLICVSGNGWHGQLDPTVDTVHPPINAVSIPDLCLLY
jgi:hypothetical protein